MLTDPEKTLRSFVELVLPESSARAGWTFDPEAIIDAKDEFSITLNIKFRFSAARITRGTHRIKQDWQTKEIHHSIVVSQDWPIATANETIWHELTHAWQAEAWAKAANKENPIGFYRLAYKPMDGPHGSSYWDNKFEKHARQTAEAHKDKYLVINCGKGIWD